MQIRHQLKDVYCSAFASYYMNANRSQTKVLQPYTNETSKFCDNRDQTGFHISRDYYLKHKDEYK